MGIIARYLDYLDHLGQTVPVNALRASTTDTDVVGLRHDVDHDIDIALEMGWWEQRRGCRSTYFLLHTAPYWEADPRLEDKALQLQDWGHEVGLHVNALTEWSSAVIDDVETRLRELLARLRDAGVQIDGVSAHGDRACYEHQFANYWCWRELRPNFPEQRETGRSAEGIRVANPAYQLTYPADHRLLRYDGAEYELWQLSLREMGLSYDAAHVHADGYFTDSGGSWTRSPDPLEEDLSSGRHQVLVHPEHWREERRRSWFVLSTARSGSRWLIETLARASPVTARHELTLNHRYRDGQLLAEKRTADGFAELARLPDELRGLMVEARLWMDEHARDYVEANVYLVHALEQVDAVFPDAHLVHLHREPAAVVRSLLNRDWFDTPEDDRHARVHIDGWERMTQLERVCWYVRRANETLLERHLPRLALEEITSDPSALGAALEPFDLPFYPRLAAPGYYERVNVNSVDRIPATEQWPASDRSTFVRICGPVRRRLGYTARPHNELLRRLGSFLRTLTPPRAAARTTPTPEVLLDERFQDPAARPAVLGAQARWTNEGLVAIPDGDRHVQVLFGTRRWHSAEPQDGWATVLGGWFRMEVHPGTALDGAFSVFCLMYAGDGQLLAQRRLGTTRGIDPVFASFGTRADAARFALAIQASMSSLPRVVAVRRVTLEHVPR